MTKLLSTRVQHLILPVSGQKPTVPGANTMPDSPTWRWSDIMEGEFAWNRPDNIWYYRDGGTIEVLGSTPPEVITPELTAAYDPEKPNDPGTGFAYISGSDFVTYINGSSPDPEFQILQIYLCIESAYTGESPETHPEKWEPKGNSVEIHSNSLSQIFFANELEIKAITGYIKGSNIVNLANGAILKYDSEATSGVQPNDNAGSTGRWVKVGQLANSNYWTLTSQQALFPSNDISLTNSSVKHVSVSEVTILHSETDSYLFSGNFIISDGLTFEEYLEFLKLLPDWGYSPESNVCFYEGSEYISVTTNTGTYLAYLGAIGYYKDDPVIEINFDDPIPGFTQIEYDQAILRKVKLTGLPSEPSVEDEAVSAEYVEGLVDSLSDSLFGSLSSVARSGDYNDLLNKPSIPKMPKEFLIPGSRALKNYLYNWYALQHLSSGNGWRIPTNEDFQTLSTYLGTNGGTKLQSELSVNEYPFTWNTPGTNDYSFSLFPLGFASANSFDTSKAAHFWTSYNSSTAYGGHYVIFSTGEISYISVSKNSGIGVRLCKDYSGDYEEGILIHDAYRGNDGRLYPAVRIGNKLWLAENLSETKYNDNTEITFSSDFTEWAAVGTNRGVIKHSFQEQAGFIPSQDFKEKPGLRFIQEKINIKAGDEDYELSVVEGGLAVKNKTRGDGSNRLLQYVFLSGPLTDGAPSAAEITSVITAAGYNISDIQSYFILDSNGSGLLYHVISNGTKFYYTTFNEAI